MRLPHFSPHARVVLGILCLIIAFLGLFYRNMVVQKNVLKPATVSESTLETATALTPPKALPAFSLYKTDHTVLTPLDFQRHWSLVFFGFSHCPDVCPTALGHLTAVWNTLHQSIPSLQVVFIGIDPERDNLEKIGQYLSQFSAPIIGATGDVSELNRVSQHLGALFFKTRAPSEGDAYFMDHSGHFAFVNPAGEWSAIFSPPHDPQAIARDISRLVTTWHK